MKLIHTLKSLPGKSSRTGRVLFVKLFRMAAMVILSFMIILPIVFDVNAEQNAPASEEAATSGGETTAESMQEGTEITAGSDASQTTGENTGEGSVNGTVPDGGMSSSDGSVSGDASSDTGDTTSGSASSETESTPGGGTPAAETTTQDGNTSGTEGSTDNAGQGTGGNINMDDINQEKENIKSKRQEAQELLDRLKGDKTDIVTSAQLIDEKITEYQQLIEDIEEQSTLLEEEISTQTVLLEEALEQEEIQYELLKSRIQMIYESGNYTYLDAFLNAANFAEVLNYSEYISQVSEYDSNELNKLADIRENIANKQQLLTLKGNNLEELKKEYLDDQEALQLLWDGKQVQINNFDASIETVESNIEKLDKDEETLDAKIALMEAQSNQIIIISGDFSGDFAWPMPISTNITSRFGPRNRPTAGASSYHRGIDIACPQGSNVVSAADGVVMYVGYMSSAGNAVLVNHGNGVVTCYYHLSAFNCNVGDSVVKGQVIALSGNTGVSTGPHLHFAIRINGQYVDPMGYF